MMSWTISSQTTTTKVVKVSVLKNMKRKIDKCDSLAVAHINLKKEFDFIVETNIEYFKRVSEEEAKRIQLQKQYDESVEALKKKKSNWALPTSLGVVGGLVVGMLLSN